MMIRAAHFAAETMDRVPGDTRLRLLATWAGLDRGTEILPMSAGHSNIRNRDQRTVLVVSGPYAGDIITAEA